MADYSNPVQNPKSRESIAEGLKRLKEKKKNTNEEATQETQILKFVYTCAMEKNMSDDDIRRLFQGNETILYQIGAVRRVPEDPNYKNVSSDYVTNVIKTTTVIPDGAMFSKLATEPYRQNREFALFTEYLKELSSVRDWVVTNGPTKGLFKRLHVGVTSTKVHWKDLPPSAPDKFKRSFGINSDLFVNMLKDDVELWDNFEYNRHANAGYPFQVDKAECIDKIWEKMIETYNLISDGGLKDHMTKYPEWYLVQLKNKGDRYLKAETDVKIRPYYVFPAHLCGLFTILWDNISKTFSTFDKTPGSNLAIGFSWNYGGGQRLYEWIITRPNGFSWMAYSDDALWVIKVGGKTYVVCPDVKHMDMSLPVECGKFMLKILKSLFGDRLNKTWLQILALNCMMAFQCSVAMNNSMVYHFKDMLKTGIPGTSYFDQLASFIIAEYAVPLCNVESKTFVKDVAAKVKQMMGLEIKEETLKVYEFEPNQPSYDFVFLGQTLTQVKGYQRLEYIPKTPLLSVMKGLVLPRRTYKSTTSKVNAYLERYRGVMASGGFHYPQVMSVVREYYDSMRAVGYEPMDELLEENATIPIIFPDQDFPSSNWIHNLYLNPDNSLTDEFSNPLSTSPTELEKLEKRVSAMVPGDDEDEWEGLFAPPAIIPPPAGPKQTPPVPPKKTKTTAMDIVEFSKASADIRPTDTGYWADEREDLRPSTGAANQMAVPDSLKVQKQKKAPKVKVKKDKKEKYVVHRESVKDTGPRGRDKRSERHFIERDDSPPPLPEQYTSSDEDYSYRE